MHSEKWIERKEAMKKKYWVIGACVVGLVVVGSIIYTSLHVSFNKNEDGTSVSIIGGADGPTSIFLAGKLGGDDVVAEYTQITMDEAKEIFAAAGDYIILDVRHADEFAEGHIPGAINIANEDIISDPPAELSDRDQVIYVYCRSGRRSAEAASKLAAMGYTNIVDCGGILDWTGTVEK